MRKGWIFKNKEENQKNKNRKRTPEKGFIR